MIRRQKPYLDRPALSLECRPYRIRASEAHEPAPDLPKGIFSTLGDVVRRRDPRVQPPVQPPDVEKLRPR